MKFVSIVELSMELEYEFTIVGDTLQSCGCLVTEVGELGA